MQFLIKNGNVVLHNTIKKLDILIQNETINQISEHISRDDAIVVDCSGLFILPGLVDMHVHLRDPGFLEKETLQTGCNAAAAGGFSLVCCMPNTKPVVDCPEIAEQIQHRSKKCSAEIFTISAITKNLEGSQLVDFEAMANSGVVAFSDDGNCVENDYLMEKALISANKLNKIIISHCEKTELTKDGLVNEGIVSNALNLKGISNLSESLVVSHHIKLAKKLNCKIHIAHVSTKESVLEIRKAKASGVKVTAETCPHYFCLTDEELLKKNANCKINPPLRSEIDRKTIENAVIDNTIDCIVTDHAPHTVLEKQNFLTAPNGAIGLETSLACTLTNFFHTKKLNLHEILNLMSKKPCEILNLPILEIKPGATANFTVVDLYKKWVVRSENFKSKSRNSPFEGKTLTGKVIKTFFKGTPVFSDTNST